MSAPHFRPIPGDPGAVHVEAMFDARAERWILASAGDYQSAAVQAIRADGTMLQNCVALEWPGRINHTDECVTVRLLMSPEDAVELAKVLQHSGLWMLARGLK
jgi:hypothetical protein